MQVSIGKRWTIAGILLGLVCIAIVGTYLFQSSNKALVDLPPSNASQAEQRTPDTTISRVYPMTTILEIADQFDEPARKKILDASQRYMGYSYDTFFIKRDSFSKTDASLSFQVESFDGYCMYDFRIEESQKGQIEASMVYLGGDNQPDIPLQCLNVDSPIDGEEYMAE